MYSSVSVGLKCVRTSRIESFLNLTPLYTFVSKNVVSVSDISAVNLIVGWNLFAFRRNSSTSFLLVSHTDMASSINLFQKMGLMLLCLSISFSFLAMKMLDKGYGHFRAHGCSMGLKIIFLVKLVRASSSIRLSISLKNLKKKKNLIKNCRLPS